MNSHERIANNIRAEITRKGYSIKDFSMKIGVSYDTYINTLNRFSKGHDMRLSFLEKTSEGLSVPIEIFFKQ
jgi:transcriptional regulator with XRE-family HTH domain